MRKGAAAAVPVARSEWLYSSEMELDFMVMPRCASSGLLSMYRT